MLVRRRKDRLAPQRYAGGYVLRELLRCACGSPMVGTSNRSYRYYRCKARCGRPSVRANDLDAGVMDLIRRTLSTRSRSWRTGRSLDAREGDGLADPCARIGQASSTTTTPVMRGCTSHRKKYSPGSSAGISYVTVSSAIVSPTKRDADAESSV